jgi:SAM-dependent methyltransferase
MKQSSILDPDKFYDEISGIYEKMTDFEKNLALRIDAYKSIFPSKGFAADIGCGTGLDSIALSTNGHNVTAFDVSAKMIETVKQNSLRYGFDIGTGLYSFESIPKSFNSKFSSIVSVGNTIAHLSPLQLQKAIEKIYNMLVPEGKVLLHILNYKLLKKQGKRINNITSREGSIFIRFYDFLEKAIDFNILSFSPIKPNDFQLVTTRHYPHTKSSISGYLRNAGFKRIRFMKNFDGNKFNSFDSKDLFIVFEK